MNTSIETLRQRVQAASRHARTNEPLDDAFLEPSRPMRCPKCASGMETITFKGIQIDRCTGCGGLWFDVLEHEELRHLEGSERVDAGDAAKGASFDHAPGTFRCPRCDTPMTRVTDPHQPHIHFEKCPRDYGVFFDAGEFRDFKDFTLRERLHELFGV